MKDMTEEIKMLDKIAEQEHILPATKETLINSYTPAQQGIASILGVSRNITDGEDPNARKQARAYRLELKQHRTSVEAVRKDLKAEALRYGKAVDGMANVIKFIAQTEEERLDTIEKHEELKEQARKQALASDRQEQLAALGALTTTLDLGSMPEADWNLILEGARLAKQKQEDETRKAEEAHVAWAKAEAEERERLKAEAEKLRQKEEDRKLRHGTRLSLIRQLDPDRSFEHTFLGDMTEEIFHEFEYQVTEEKREREAEAARIKVEAETIARLHKERLQSVKAIDASANIAGVNFGVMLPKQFQVFLDQVTINKAEREKLEKAQVKARELEKARKAEAAKAKAEAEAKAKAEAEAAKAPDKQKLRVYLTAIKEVPMAIPETPEARELLTLFVDELTPVFDRFEIKLEQL